MRQRSSRPIPAVKPLEPSHEVRRAYPEPHSEQSAGKLDLTEAEGLDDLVRAETDRQRRQALRQLKGLLGDRARD